MRDFNFMLRYKLKHMQIYEQCFYFCSTFHNYSRVFNNEYNLYPKMSVK